MTYKKLIKTFVGSILLLISMTFFLSGCNNNMETDVENSDMGYVQEDVTSTEIPPELIGTWEVSDGLPPDLNSYLLTFNENGQVVQKSKINKDDETTQTSNFIMDNDIVKILDPNNTVLMSLNYKDGTLITKDLGANETTFSKIS